MSVKIIQNIEDYKLDFIEKEVKRICTPLFLGSRISFFEYDLAFQDYSRITITSNPEWVYSYYRSGYYTEGIHHRDIRTYRKGYNLWNAVGRSSVIDLAKNQFRACDQLS